MSIQRSRELQYLYRGINKEMFSRDGCLLIPKKLSVAFVAPFILNYTLLNSCPVKNAVKEHHEGSKHFTGSGISTTKSYAIAKNFALHNGKYSEGYVFVIDFSQLMDFNISLYDVNKELEEPRYPEQEEVILVTEDGGPLPESLIIKRECICR